ncbi:cell division protein SepF [Aerococcus agrisoli]|uniref:Cell division protein SepF n=1 Tax=Aerococcus agrisoli TaxID=2487350 RepID=A0A3N4GDC3_9LACT|nr:cell division protein SepF [Aerococcus agrisoli]RPA60823.1 cell division protein SepF [Aerococcus agrisoli]
MALKDFFSNIFGNDDENYDDDYEAYEAQDGIENQAPYTSQEPAYTAPIVDKQVNTQQATKEQNKVMANDANRNNVVNINETRKTSATVEVFKPRIFAEAERISQSLLAGKSVVLNLAQMSDDDARRFVDYMTGVVYAINGDLQRVASDVFIAVPETVHIEGLYEEYTNNHAASKATRERGNIWEREGESRE